MKRNLKKDILVFISVFIFSFFLINSVLLIDKNSFIKTNVFKKISSSVNEYFIKKMYHIPKTSNNVLNEEINYLKKENNELKEILDLNNNTNNTLPSYVTNQVSRIWFNKIYIKTNKRVKKDSAVINASGLVGFIDKTKKNISEVNLINNVNDNTSFSVLVKNGDSKILGVLCDYDEKQELFKVKDVITDKQINENDKVVLKEFEQVYIGDVVKVENDDYGLSKVVWVKSYVNFDDLLYVLVVMK